MRRFRLSHDGCTGGLFTGWLPGVVWFGGVPAVVDVAVAVDTTEARAGGESLPTSCAAAAAAACCASAIWRKVLGRSVRGPRIKGCLAKVQETPAATHAGQGGMPAHLILRTLQPSQARLLILRPGADIAAAIGYTAYGRARVWLPPAPHTTNSTVCLEGVFEWSRRRSVNA